MTCDELQLLLDREPAALLDRTAPPDALRRVDRHLATCSACAAAAATARSLRRQADRLAAGIEPGRDLWPGVRHRLTARRRPWWRAAVARAGGGRRAPTSAPAGAFALTAVALLVGLALWLAWHTPAATPRLAAAPAGAVRAEVARREAAAADTTLALLRNDLAATLERRGARLDPATRVEVEASLATVRDAIGELRGALVRNPDSVRLNHLLAGNYRREVEILNRLNRI